MPAMTGGVILTLTDGTGAPIFVITEWFTPATNAMRNVVTSTSTGNKNAALIVDNMTGKQQAVTITDLGTGTVRSLNVPANGVALTAAQLASLAPPFGPINTIQDLAGISPALT